jgi:hypothetical protein
MRITLGAALVLVLASGALAQSSAKKKSPRAEKKRADAASTSAGALG